MGPLLTREAAACATFHKSHKWHTARRFVPVLWFGTFHGIGRKGEPTGKERKKGARVKTTAPPVLSSTAQKVTRRTITGANASYSLKPAESLSRCPHTRQGLKALLGAPRHLSQLISAAYRSQPQKPAKINHPIDFLNNWPPSTDQANFERIVTIVNNWPPSIENPKIPQIVTIVHNSKLLRIVKDCYKMLRIITKCQMLRIVTKCYEMLRNVTICNNSTFVLQYACTIENDSHSQ